MDNLKDETNETNTQATSPPSETKPEDMLTVNPGAELEVIDYYDDAKKLYDCKEDLLYYMMDICHYIHHGDNHIKLSLILSYAATRIENCGGIHVSICGDAGSGKSHVADTVSKILPSGATVKGRFSNMALFYSPSLSSKKVIVMDDQSLAEEFTEILKNSTSDWEVPYIHHTVVNQKGKSLLLPPRLVYWLIKASELGGDEQVMDRVIHTFCDDTLEQRTRVLKNISAEANGEMIITDDIHKKIRIAQELWGILPQSATVYVPYARDILFNPASTPYRLHVMMFDLVRCFAYMRSNRRRMDKNGRILANIADFYGALGVLNPLIKGKGGNQSLKLGKNETKVLNWLKTMPEGHYTYEEITKGTGLSYMAVSRTIIGRADRPGTPLISVPGISQTRVSIKDPCEIDEDYGVPVNFHTVSSKQIYWEPEVYQNSTLVDVYSMDPERLKYWMELEDRL
ncbi:MAG TPA: hypothetical protein O0X21_03770 [Methanocorpusculum sp.]|nr:hypothetical protein [Methanocorpusculum sp.]